MPTRKRRTFDVAPALDRQLRVVAPRVPSEVRTVCYVGLVLLILRSVKKRMGFGENALLESNVEARDVDRNHEPDIAERMLQVCEKAIGRGLEVSDSPTVEKIAQRTAADDYRFSKLVMEVINSEPFQMRSAEGGVR